MYAGFNSYIIYSEFFWKFQKFHKVLSLNDYQISIQCIKWYKGVLRLLRILPCQTAKECKNTYVQR